MQFSLSTSTPWLIMLVARTAFGVTDIPGPGISRSSRIRVTSSVLVPPESSAIRKGEQPACASSVFTCASRSVRTELSSLVAEKYAHDVRYGSRRRRHWDVPGLISLVKGAWLVLGGG